MSEQILQMSLISKGDNYPQTDFSGEKIKQLYLAIHQGSSLTKIKEEIELNQVEFETIINSLVADELIRFGGDKEYPQTTGFVATLNDGPTLFGLTEPLQNEIVSLIEEKVPEIEERLKKIDDLKRTSIGDLSLLIYSNILLDNWQIDQIETSYLRQERPTRGTKQYYISLMECCGTDEKAFGIFGNQCTSSSEKKSHWQYGKYCALSDDQNEKLIVSRELNENFFRISKLLTSELIEILEKNDSTIKNFHVRSKWKNIKFQEFFIWWYHFLYTVITNSLISKKIIQNDNKRNIQYTLLHG